MKKLKTLLLILIVVGLSQACAVYSCPTYADVPTDDQEVKL